MDGALKAFQLDGRSAAVTGAASGIGRGIALRFAQAGADLCLLDRDGPGLKATGSEVRALGRRAHLHRVDVSREAELAEALETAVADLGRLDVMANIAGLGGKAAAHEITDALLEELWSVHVKGTVFGTKAALRIMARLGHGGSIINCGSTVMDRPGPGLSVYAMCKGAIAAFTRAVALEQGPAGVRCNVLAPGLTITPATDRQGLDEHGKFSAERRDAWIEAMTARLPLRRVGEVDDMANLALFLASDASRFLTGEIIRCDGGFALG